MFSGSALTQQSVASASDILNGNGTQAGFTQVISERLQADQGVGGLGRLTIGGTAPSVTMSPDSSPFGFKLASVSSNLTGATVTGSPPSISVDLGSNPNAGDTISFGLTLPDGSSQTITLTATTASPPGANQFTIGATANATATNLQAALTTAVSNLAQTALPAASAIAAANNFFSSDPPQRVNAGPPANFATATSLQTAPPPIRCFGTPARMAHAGAADSDRPGRSDDDDRLRHARQRAGDQHAGRQCRGAGRDHVFGKQSERAGELSGAYAKASPPISMGQPGTQTVSGHRGRPRQCPDEGCQRNDIEHPNAEDAAEHAAGHRRRQSESDRRKDLDAAEQSLGVDVGDREAGANQLGQLPVAVEPDSG